MNNNNTKINKENKGKSKSKNIKTAPQTEATSAALIQNPFKNEK